MSDEDLPIMTESQYNAAVASGGVGITSSDDDLPTITESEFNKLSTGSADKSSVMGFIDSVNRYNPFTPEGVDNVGKSLLKGGTDLVGSIADYNPFSVSGQERLGVAGTRIADWLTGTKTKIDPALQARVNESAVSPLLEGLREKYVGSAVPRNTAERYLNKGIEFIPSALSGNLLEVTAAVGGGIGAEAAKDVGLPEWAGALIGTVATHGAGTAAKNLAHPLETLAGRELLANAGAEGRQNIAEALARNGGQGDFGPLTYAELADTPSAAAFQTQVTKIPSESTNAFEAQLAERAQSRIKELKSTAPDALRQEPESKVFDLVPVEDRGRIIQEEASPIVSEAMSDRSEPFSVITEKYGAEQVPILKEKVALAKVVKSRYGESALPPDGDVSKIVDGFLNTDNIATLSRLRALDVDATTVMKKTAKGSNDMAVLAEVKTQINKSIERAVESGKVDPRVSFDLQVAKDNYKFNTDKFGNKVIKGITDKNMSGFVKTEESVPKFIIKDQESAKRFTRAFGGNERLMNQARGALLDDALGKKSVESWPKVYDSKKSQFKELFWRGDDYKKVERVMNDVRSLNRVTELATRASKGQSATAQFNTVAGSLIAGGPRQLIKLAASRAFSGAALGASAISLNPGAAIAGLATGAAARWAEKNIESIIIKSMADPDLLKVVSARASDAGMRQAAKKIVPLLAAEYAKVSNGSKAEEKKMSVQKTQQAESIPKETKSEKTVEAPKVLEAKRVSSRENLYKALTAQESDGDPNAVSSVGAVGLMQIMPDTAKDIARELGVKEYDLKDPETNKKFGKYYLDKLINKYGGDIKLALTAYHSGMGTVDRLLKATNGTTLDDILYAKTEDKLGRTVKLGPVGRAYARGVISKLKKIDSTQA